MQINELIGTTVGARFIAPIADLSAIGGSSTIQINKLIGTSVGARFIAPIADLSAFGGCSK